MGFRKGPRNPLASGNTVPEVPRLPEAPSCNWVSRLRNLYSGMLLLLEACFRKAVPCCLQGLHSLLLRLSFNQFGWLLLGCMSAECRNHCTVWFCCCCLHIGSPNTPNKLLTRL
jgi:hypothetical protein